MPFTGAHERRHPLLRTATGNNTVLPVPRAEAGSRYRFPLDFSPSLPAGRMREAMMDANPWTYQVMAQEMAREGKLESPASADTPALSDQRDYLFAEVEKATSYPVAPAAGGWVGVALAVRLRGERPLVRVRPRRGRLVDPARRSGGHDDRAASGDAALRTSSP